MSITDKDRNALRNVLKSLNPTSASKANDPLQPSQLYSPVSHESALRFDRQIVVGNRGAGKSVWAGALTNDARRNAIAGSYPQLKLRSFVVKLGFYENADDTDLAPSKDMLKALVKNDEDAEYVWLAVLYKALGLEGDLKKAIQKIKQNPNEIGPNLKEKNNLYKSKNQHFLLVFDSLDRMSDDWRKTDMLIKGLLRLAQRLESYENLRTKIFMRPDQYGLDIYWKFADASKLKNQCAYLEWKDIDLYNLLFKELFSGEPDPFGRLLNNALNKAMGKEYSPIQERDEQISLFDQLAGQFMGTGSRRGRTYPWVVNHLADAEQKTTPRSFLLALRRAAEASSISQNLVIDYKGIKDGVQQASGTRLDELKEDFSWIGNVLENLEGLAVPCDSLVFISRWKEKNILASLENGQNRTLGDITNEEALLEKLIAIKVIERRKDSRINMPDIFRVAAKIKRRGGVKPAG
jgi:hypothetical protein